MQIVQAPTGISRTVGERIPARSTAVLSEGIKEVAGLAGSRTIARSQRPVLSLDVDADQRPGPVQRIRNHDTGPLPCARGRGERHALLAGEHQTASPAGSQNDPLVA